MASDMRKPMGITVLRRQEIERKLWPLSIADMFGIGKKTVPLLERQGIYTIGDFANPANEAKIMALMGKHAYQLIQNARGFGSNRLDYNTSVQSISQSTTLDTNIVEYEEVKSVFKRLANKLSQRAKQEDLRGALISISIRYADFTNAVRSTTISEYTNDADVLLEHALLLFDQHINGKEIRHLGIGLGSLFSKTRTVDQINLFQDVKAEPTDSTDILKQLNKQLSTGKLMKASELLKK